MLLEHGALTRACSISAHMADRVQCLFAVKTILPDQFLFGVAVVHDKVICNDWVGDVAMQIKQLGAGIIVDPASDADLSDVGQKLDEVFAMGGQRLRDAARPLLGLEVAEERYRFVYSKLN